MPSCSVTRRGVRLAYQRRGAGPPVLLLQGLGMSSAMWLSLPGGLVKSGHLVITPDNRGSGASDAPRRPYSMGSLAADMVAVLDDAGVERALVAGISLGGMIALRLAIDHPERVGALVLAATTCGLPLGKPVRPKVVLEMTRALSGSAAAVKRMRKLLVHPDSLRQTPDLFATWDRAVAGGPPRLAGVLAQLAAAAGHSACRGLGSIACPTEVLTGDSDAIIPPQNSRLLAERIPGARLTEVPNAGHAFPLEDPAALPRAVSRALRRMERSNA